MSQTPNETPALNNTEQAKPINVSKESGQLAPETAAMSPRQDAAPADLSAIPGLQTFPVDQAQNTNDNQTSDVANTTSPSGPKIIEDSDLIEKEWVDKAKRIVERNRDDPFKQSQELTEVRAEYMKKVYNKTIKTDK